MKRQSISYIFILLIGFAVTSFSFSFAQTGASFIQLSKYYSFPGETIRVIGEGFSPYENITLDAFGESRTYVADSSGRFSGITTAIPDRNIDSEQKVIARGSKGNSGLASVVVGTYYPEIEPSSYYIIPGGKVSFSGKYFAPGEKVVVKRNSTSIGYVTASENGDFRTIQIPVAFSGGDQVYSFEGQKTKTSVERTVTIASVKPYILLSMYYDRPGTNVTVSGFAFGSKETVDIYVGNNKVGDAVTDASGRFSTVVKVPSTSLDKIEFRVQGRFTGVRANESFTLARQ